MEEAEAKAAGGGIVRKNASAEAGFLLVEQLRKLECRDFEFYGHDLLSIFHSVDVTLHGKIHDFLVEGLGREQGQKVMAKSVATWKCLPLQFENTASYGMTVACRSVSGGATEEEERKDVEAEEGDADGEEKEEKKIHGAGVTRFVQEVTATSECRPFIVGTVQAVIREGDAVRLQSPSMRWWFVHEMRPSKGMVMLSSSLLSAAGTKPEYREVRLSSLLGCLVRREGVLSVRTLAMLQRDGGELDFQHRLICRPEEALAEGYVPGKDEHDGPGSRRLAMLFQMPGPDMRRSLAHMRTLVQEFPARRESTPAFSSSSSASGNLASSVSLQASLDPLAQMQAQAQAKAYMQRWEEAQRARQLVVQLDPFACVVPREKWLLLCRSLRTISRGGAELLPDFLALTRKAGREGLLRAGDCRVAWESLRPTTSADLPALSKARAYLKMRGAGKQAAFFDDEGRLRPEAMQADALSRGILEAASTYLADRSLVFLKQALQGTITVAATAALHLDEGAETVPAATYEHHVSPVGEVRTRYLGEEAALRAFLSAGDALLVRSRAREPPAWMQLLSVDLLFARLRVVPCAAPPLCWHPAHAQHGQACWLPLSRLWDVTVCRALPPAEPEADDEARGRHLIFVCPMPSPAEALAVLAALDRIPDKGKEEKEEEVGLGGKEKRVLNVPKGVKATTKATPPVRQGKFSVTALSYFTDAVVVSWTPLVVKPRSYVDSEGKLVTPIGPAPSTYTVEVALVSAPHNWLSVYSGSGLGCQISGLEPLCQYYCRVSASALPADQTGRPGGRPTDATDRRRAQTVLSTLGAPLPCCPAALSWEPASTPGSVRGLVALFDPSSDWVQPLPAGCFFQLEAQQPGSIEWVAVGRARTHRLWIAGPFSGKTLLLRTRVVNQIGQPGTSSPVAVVEVPPVPV